MSWKATAHIKELTHAPNGEAITRSEKLLLLIIADYYNDEKRCAWASVPTIAKNALLSERRVRQVFQSLTEKRALLAIHRSGKSSIYKLPTLTPEIISGVKSTSPTPEISSIPLKPASPPPLKPSSGKPQLEPSCIEPQVERASRAREENCSSKFSYEQRVTYAESQRGVKNAAAFARAIADGSEDAAIERWRQPIIKEPAGWREHYTGKLTGYLGFVEGSTLELAQMVLRELPTMTFDEWKDRKETLLEIGLEIV
jgi:hypothetical protein